MSGIRLEGLNPVASKKIRPFLEEALQRYPENIHSIHVIGSATTGDFDEKGSDVNSVFVLKEMDLGFLEVIAPLGRKYSKQRVAAPLIMTPEYIARSLDVFPIEFLNIKLMHVTVLGEDIFRDIEIHRHDLRHQCEREIKVKLIALRQGYISSMGDRKMLTEGLIRSISDYIPMFRGIILLLGQEPPVRQDEVISALAHVTGIDTSVFTKVLRTKRQQAKLSSEELRAIFEDYYKATEALGKVVDEITA